MTINTPAAKDNELDSVAFAALNALNRPVGVVGSDGRVVVANAPFCDLFCGKSCGGDPRSCRELIGDLDAAARRGPFVHRDGRAFRAETARLPQGLLVFAEDVSQQVRDEAKAAESSAAKEILPANREAFRRRLAEFLQANGPGGGAAAVLAVGIGRFKALRASVDRNAGDAVMRLVADRLRSTLADGDCFACVGEDEFLVFRAGSPQPRAATVLAARLVELLGRSYLADGRLFNMDACVGICVVAADGGDCDRIVDDAELALAAARLDGPGRFRLFEAAMAAEREDRRTLEVDLRRALALRQLSLAYQPQYNLDSGRVTGFEALLRWRHPTRGIVSPAVFIPIAEDLGLIATLGEWVLRSACRDAAEWPAGLRVAVNVSALQFRDAKLCGQVSSALADSGLDPHRLELEITESVLIGDHGSVLGELRRMRETGLRVSMDDFGTGYSSLSHLHSFPFDKIKIDQSFVRGVIDEASSAAIVRAVAALGRSLGMTTTAEGVETEAQLDRVRAAGCTDVQGYLISRPLSREDVGPFLQSIQPGAAAVAAE